MRRLLHFLLMSVILTMLIISYWSCAGTKPEDNKLDFVTIDEEMSLGKELVNEAVLQLKLIHNPEVTKFFNGIAATIGSKSDWDAMEYSVYVVNDPGINHFSLPGGSIYLFKGLIDSVKNVSEIAAVIAHEIAHISNRDGVDRISTKFTFAFAAQSVFGDNQEIPKQIVGNLFSANTILDYPKSSELLADQKSVQYCWRANYEPTGMIKVLELIKTNMVTNPDLVALLNSTHPSVTDRYKVVQGQVSKLSGGVNLIKDDPEFARIKELLNN